MYSGLPRKTICEETGQILHQDTGFKREFDPQRFSKRNYDRTMRDTAVNSTNITTDVAMGLAVEGCGACNGSGEKVIGGAEDFAIVFCDCSKGREAAADQADILSDHGA